MRYENIKANASFTDLEVWMSEAAGKEIVVYTGPSLEWSKGATAPIDFDGKLNSIHWFWQFSFENDGYSETLHPLIKNPKEGPDVQLWQKDNTPIT